MRQRSGRSPAAGSAGFAGCADFSNYAGAAGVIGGGQEIGDVTPIGGFDNGESSASCPSGYLATGGGYARDVDQALKLAYAVVGCELLAIAWLRRRYLRVSLAGSLTQVTLAGGLVAAVGVAVGHG